MRQLRVLLLWFAPHALELAIILAPTTIYLLVLGLHVHARPHPVVWTGRRNIAWLAFAVSGFFLVGPPTWVFSRLLWYSPWFYLSAWFVYVATLAWLLSLWLKRQRKRLVIFNIRPDDLALVLAKIGHSQPSTQLDSSENVVLREGMTIHIELAAAWFAAELTCHSKDQADFDWLRQRLEETLPTVQTPTHFARRLCSLLGSLLAILSTQAVSLYVWYLAH